MIQYAEQMQKLKLSACPGVGALRLCASVLLLILADVRPSIAQRSPDLGPEPIATGAVTATSHTELRDESVFSLRVPWPPSQICFVKPRQMHVAEACRGLDLATLAGPPLPTDVEATLLADAVFTAAPGMPRLRILRAPAGRARSLAQAQRIVAQLLARLQRTSDAVGKLRIDDQHLPAPALLRLGSLLRLRQEVVMRSVDRELLQLVNGVSAAQSIYILVLVVPVEHGGQGRQLEEQLLASIQASSVGRARESDAEPWGYLTGLLLALLMGGIFWRERTLRRNPSSNNPSREAAPPAKVLLTAQQTDPPPDGPSRGAAPPAKALLDESELIPGELWMRAYEREISMGCSAAAALGAAPPSDAAGNRAMTYVTRGLAAHGQPELVLNVTLREGESGASVLPDPRSFFQAIYGLAKSGAGVSPGGFSQFGNPGFLGDARFIGVMYQEAGAGEAAQAEAEPRQGRGPSPQLAVIALTQEEMQAVMETGGSRLMAALGRMYRYYPGPFWNERGRASAVSAATLEQTILVKIARWGCAGLYVRKDGDRLLLQLPRSQSQEIERFLPLLDQEQPSALMAQIDPAANACLTWAAGDQALVAIAPPGSDGSRLAGLFVALLPNQASDLMRVVEDGFLLGLRADSFRAVRDALAKQATLSLPLAEGAAALDISWYEPAAGQSADCEGAFSVHLLNPDAELRVRIRSDIKALSDYFAALVRIIDTWKTQQASRASAGLLVAVGVKPGRRARVWCESGSDPDLLLDTELSALSAELSGVTPLEVVKGPIAFVLRPSQGEPSDGVPPLPCSWQRAAATYGRPLRIPDMLFDLVWPD